MKAVSLVDTLRWTEDGDIKTVDGKGVEVDLPADEFDRLEAAGAVEKPAPAKSRSKAAKDAADETGE